jgi:hypothetical protein
MRERGYALAFALVLVAIVVGAFFGGRFVVQRFRQDFRFRQEWSPPELSTELPASPAPEATLQTEAAAPTRRSAPTQVVIPSPVAPTPEPFTTPVPPSSTRPKVTAPAETRETTPPAETSTPFPTPPPAEPFAVNGAVRASLGDCGGNYVLGRITARNGDPLPGVRVRLLDEFANEAFAVTKSGQSDMGRYDFPVSGPPRRFSVSVVDESGAALSRPAGFAYYGDSADAQASCYWVDWQRR